MKAIKVQDLVRPVIGTYLGTKKGKQNKLDYIVQEVEGPVKLLGVVALDHGFINKAVGSRVRVAFLGKEVLDNGFIRFKVSVENV
jgi:hypothetical protein